MYERYYPKELAIRLLLRGGFRWQFIKNLTHEEQISLVNYMLLDNTTYIDE